MTRRPDLERLLEVAMHDDLEVPEVKLFPCQASWGDVKREPHRVVQPEPAWRPSDPVPA